MSRTLLLRAMCSHYRENFERQLREIQSSEKTAIGMVRAFLAALEGYLDDDRRVCLCGMLAAGSESLSKEMRAELQLFFKISSAWLAAVLERGRAEGLFRFDASSQEVAMTLLASLQGILISSRVAGGRKDFRKLSEHLLRSFFPKFSWR